MIFNLSCLRRSQTRGLFLILPWLLLSWATNACGETPASSRWNRFRGENGDGLLKECTVQIPWAESQVTRIPLPGTGNGSPIVLNGHVFVQCAESNTATRQVVSIEIEHNQIDWTNSYASVPHPLHKFSSYASSTPCTDGERIFVAWADPENVVVKSLAQTGEELWTRTLGRYVSQHGFGTSPIVVDGKVILLNSQDAQELPPGVEPGSDSMIALDASTGLTRWETKLPTARVCYGVPCVRNVGGKNEIVCSTTAQGMFAMDVSSGQVLWHHDCFTQRVCASSLLVGNVLVGSHGSGGGKDNRLVAWDIDQKKELFSITRAAAPYVPTPVASDGLLFLWSDAGIVTCVQMKNGETLWSKRIGGDFSGSPVIVGQKLINTSHDGVVTVLAAAPEFEKLGSIELNQSVRATLAGDREHLYLRTDAELLLIR